MQTTSNAIQAHQTTGAIQTELRTTAGQTFDVHLGPAAPIASFFVFSMHKAGSTLLNQMMNVVCQSLSIPVFEPEIEEFKNGALIGTLDASVCELFRQRGFCFGGFRSFPAYLKGFQLTGFKKIFLIRDPRDILVSHYFSQKFSHAMPPGQLGQRLQEIRSSLATISIDDYALEYALPLKRKFEKYERSIFDDNLKLFRYEDVIFEKQKWLNEILAYLDLELTDLRVEELIQPFDIRPSQENPNDHIRKVTPGDHVEKLKPETIARLNDFFQEILQRYGYDQGSSPAGNPDFPNQF